MKSKIRLIHRIVLVSVLFVVLLCLTACQESTNSKYERANKLLTEGKYAEAAAIFDEISTYEDASKMSVYTKAINAAETGDYETAFTTFASLGDFKDCPMMITYYKGRQAEGSVYIGEQIHDEKWFDAIEIYESIPLFRDSKDRAENCRKAAYDQAVKSGDEGDTSFAILILQELGTYSDATDQATYYMAVHLLNHGDYSGASRNFSTIPGFRDADNLVTTALEDGYKAATAKEELGELDEANAIFLNLGEYKDSVDRAYKLYYDDGLTKRENKDWDGARAAFVKAGKYSDAEEQIRETTYQEASDLEASGDQDGAYNLFISLGEYKDSFERANKPYYEMGTAKRNAQDWDGAAAAFKKAGEYEDASTQALAVRYAEGEVKLAAKDWDGAVVAFEKAGEYEDASIRALAVRYAEGEAKLEAKDWDGAVVAFAKAGEYRDAPTQILETRYQKADAFEKEGKQSEAHDLFLDLGDYSDSFERAKKPYYEIGVAKRETGEWEDAVAAFTKAGSYSDSEDQIYATRYAEGEAKRVAKDLDGAIAAFAKAGTYSDAMKQILAISYEQGEIKRAARDWDGARTAFEKAGDYLDASEQISETTYQEAAAHMDAEQYEKAYDIYLTIRKYKDVDHLMKEDDNLTAIHAAKLKPYQTVGKYVLFGTYPQTATGDDQTPIEWIVLDYDIVNHKALLLSRYGLDVGPYNEEYKYQENIPWEKCTMRAWLNGEFLNRAFSAAEQSSILMTKVINGFSQGESESRIDGGLATMDHIFLLSYVEASQYLGVKYFFNKGNMKICAVPTAYALARGAWTDDTEYGTVAKGWWLRSPGREEGSASIVGSFSSFYDYVNFSSMYVVRPAFWLNLDSDIF